MIYLGIISSSSLVIIYFLLANKVKTFRLKDLTFSHLVHFKETELLFNLTTSIVASARMVYFYEVIKRLCLFTNYLVIISIILTLASMFALGLIPLNKNRKLHGAIANLMFISSLTFLIAFHFFAQLPINSSLTVPGRIIVLIMIAGQFILLSTHKKWGIVEAYSLIMTVVWDLYLLYILNYGIQN